MSNIIKLFNVLQGVILIIIVYIAGKYEDRFRVAIGTAEYVPLPLADQQAQASSEQSSGITSRLDEFAPVGVSRSYYGTRLQSESVKRAGSPCTHWKMER